MRVLGIDPGTRFAGFSVIQKDKRKYTLVNYGLLKMTKNEHLIDRIGSFYDFFNDKIKEEHITDLCIETPFLNKNPATFLKLGYMRGILYLLAYKNNINIHEFAPTQIKQAICYKGNSSKEQVARMVYRHFPTLEKNLKDDVTDAIAIALCKLI